MAYTLRVSCVGSEGTRYDYEFGRENDLEGRFQLDSSTQVFRPYLKSGELATIARLAGDGEQAIHGELQDEEWRLFVQAAASVLRHLRDGSEPPITAHRYYG